MTTKHSIPLHLQHQAQELLDDGAQGNTHKITTIEVPQTILVRKIAFNPDLIAYTILEAIKQ